VGCRYAPMFEALRVRTPPFRWARTGCARRKKTPAGLQSAHFTLRLICTPAALLRGAIGRVFAALVLLRPRGAERLCFAKAGDGRACARGKSSANGTASRRALLRGICGIVSGAGLIGRLEFAGDGAGAFVVGMLTGCGCRI